MRFRPLSHAIALIFTRPALSAAARRGVAVWVTPHDSFSSSIGVLGCKIDTDRVAYWPDAVDCDNICVALQYQDRKVHLLRVDHSQGAHDVSYDAWNYLYTGHSATDKPTAGGAIEMAAENVDPSKCAGLNSHQRPQVVSQRGQQYGLFGKLPWAVRLDWPDANQPSCPSMLGIPAELKSDPVHNIRYPTGDGDESAALALRFPTFMLWAAILLLLPVACSLTA